MNYKTFFYIILVSSLLIGGCSGKDRLHLEGVTGEIIEIDDESFLIQDGYNTWVLLSIDKHTIFEGKRKDEFKIGDKVKTWYSTEMLDSNPGQAGASKIEYLE